MHSLAGHPQQVRIALWVLLPTLCCCSYCAAISFLDEKKALPEQIVLQLKWEHSFQFAGYYAAEAQGYFEDRGLSVQLKEGGLGISPCEELVQGRAQYAVASPGALLFHAQGYPIQLVAPIFQHSPLCLLSLSPSPIQVPSDFVGKRLMADLDRNSEIYAMLLQEGIPLSYLSQQSHPWDWKKFLAGEAEAIGVYDFVEPYYLEREGLAYHLLYPKNYGIDFYGDCLIVAHAEARENPERVALLKEAVLLGWEYALAHPQLTIEYLLKTYPTTLSREHLQYMAQKCADYICADVIQLGHSNPGRWESIRKNYVDLGLLEETSRFERFFFRPSRPEKGRMGYLALLFAVAGVLGLLLALLFIFLNHRLHRVIDKATGELKAERDFNRSLFDTLSVLVIVVDRAGKTVFINRAAESCCGYTSQALAGKLFWEHVIPEDERSKTKTLFDAILFHKRGGPATIDWQTKSGQRRRIQWTTMVRCNSVGEVEHVIGTGVDITDRLAVEEDRERLIQMVETTPDLVSVANASQELLYLNRAGRRMLGWDLDKKLLSEKISSVHSPEVYQCIKEKILPKIIKEGHWSGETTIQPKNGQPIPVSQVVVAHYSLNGEVDYIATTMRDISAKKEAEEALRQSEERFRLVVEQSPVSMVLFQENGDLLDYNQAWRKLWDIQDPDESIGRYNIFSDEQSQKNGLSAGFGEAIEGACVDLPEVYFDPTVAGYPGRARWVHARIYPLLNAEGAIELVVVSHEDITQRKEAERALQESEERFRALVEQAPISIMMFNPDGMLFQRNTAWLDLWQPQNPGEAVGEYNLLEDPQLGKSGIHKAFQKALHGGMNDVAEMYYDPVKSGFSGRSRWLHSRLYPLTREDGSVSCVVAIQEDITDRKESALALTSSEERFRLLMEQAPLGIQVHALNGSLVQFNQAWRDLWDIRGQEEKLGAYSIRKDPYAEALGITHAFHRAAQGESVNLPPFYFDPNQVGFSSRGRWVHSRMYPLKSKQGKILQIVIMHEDVTAQKEALAALSAQQEILRGTLNATDNGILVVSSAGEVLEANPRFYEMWRIPKALRKTSRDADLIAFVQDQLLDPQDFKQHIEEVSQAAQNALDLLYFKDGRVYERHYDLLWDGKEQTGHVWSFRDITEQRQAARNLQESEEKYRALTENSSDIIMRFDSQCRVLYVNFAIEQRFAMPRQSWIGRDLAHIEILADLKSFLIEQVSLVFAQKAPHTVQYVLQERGEVFYYDWSLMPEFDEMGQVHTVISSARDITAIQKAEEEHRALEEQLHQSQKLEAVGQLAGGVAHDFNNLLQVISGYSEIALDSLAPEEALYEEVKEIRGAADRATTLVRQLLTFSRHEALQREQLDLNVLVGGLVKLLRRVIGEHIELLTLPGYELYPLQADPGQLEQVLMNLCVNARDAMPQGGRILMETANVHLEEDFVKQHPGAACGAYVLLTLSDNGAGMESEVQEHIFEPFFTTKELGRGTGLGLATVYGIVRQHDGFIQVKSEVNQGTTFEIYLPAADSKELPRPKAAVIGSAEGGTETILFAEDDAMVRNLACAVLREAGYTLVVACDGKEAIELFNKNAQKIDMALLDVVMPGFSGRIVADHIQAEDESIPVLFSSGYDFNILKMNLEDFDEKYLIHKPYNPRDLLLRIREILDQDKREEEH